MARLTWDDYFLEITDRVGGRGTCDRGKAGAIIVVDKRIVATGYVGAPSNLPHCDEAGHLMRDVIDENGKKSSHCIRTLHAEENAILQAAKHGVKLEGGALYCKMTPCFNCAKKIVQVGIKRVVAQRRYHADALSIDLFKEADVQLEIVENVFEEYEKGC
ncbi:MAG: cytidine/deoxycytidylate deaminase family protein [Patescibacteria group bacterium]